MNPQPDILGRKGGGLAYRSALRPHYDLIADLRRRDITWREITAELNRLGVPITLGGVYNFVARRLKRGRLPRLPGGGFEPVARPTAEPRLATPPTTPTPETGSPNRSKGKPFALKAPLQPTPEPKMMFKSCNDLTKG